jgi:hypothetical protein
LRSPRPQESATIRCNYPETYKYLQARKARHPKEDAIEDYTMWTVLGEPIGGEPGPRIPKPGQPVPESEQPVAAKKEETEEEYVNRRAEAYMHKSLSCRRGAGGMFFTIGGGGDGGVAFQVTG